MKNEKEFTLPFGIDFVVQQDLAVQSGFQTWRASGGSYDITCPFCGGKRKMNINTAKNLAKCNKCGCGSGYNTITLHAALCGISNQESYRDLMKRWNGLSSDVKAACRNLSGAVSAGTEPADIYIRNKVYRSLLSKLTLSKRHHDDLIARGLTEKQIEDGLYKTVPAIGLHSLAYEAVYDSEAIGEIRKHKYWGIPGFTDIRDPEKISLRGRKNGYFVPVIQKNGYISGMQIRYDNLPEDASEKEKEAYKKYSWYSSSEKETGCSVTGCENIHFAGCWRETPEIVNITEGVLKADVASALSGMPFLGLVGVNNIGQLQAALTSLQYYGAKSVNLYIDMDYRDKKEVAAALLGIKQKINSAGKHEYTVKSAAEGFNIYSCGRNYADDAADLKRYFLITSESSFPEKVIAIIDKTMIPEEKLSAEGNRLNIDYDYMNCIRNREHTIRLFDASNGFENWGLLSRTERQEVFRKTQIAEIVFEKSGLTYSEVNWNPEYKGIDDYYLYMRSLSGKSTK